MYIMCRMCASSLCTGGCGAAPRCLTAGEQREPADADALLMRWGFGEVQYPYVVCGCDSPPPGTGGVWLSLSPQARFARPRLSMVGPLRGRWTCHPQLYIYYIRSFSGGLCILCAGCAHPLCAPRAAELPHDA